MTPAQWRIVYRAQIDRWERLLRREDVRGTEGERLLQDCIALRRRDLLALGVEA